MGSPGSDTFFAALLLILPSVRIIPFTIWNTHEGSFPASCSSLFLVAAECLRER